MSTSSPRRPVRVANCSGFFGDRLSAAREMVEDGPIDVLTGDWLAELTMLILARQRMKHGAGSGYARTFLSQMNDVLGQCLAKDIKVVSNAGGLDPQGLADALQKQAESAGLSPRIAVVTGDDLSGQMAALGENGEEFGNLDTGQTLSGAGVSPLTANAYLGGRGIATALSDGADIVITGRCTDAALTIGPAAWWHGWDFDDSADLDRLAGALVTGHVIECGAQATGGNYSFFQDIPDMRQIGFPISEIADSGDSVITKHPGTGGLVSVGTVTAQLLYEIGGARYINPDVVADFSTIRLEQVGRDRVRISGVVGLPPPDRLKVSMNYLGGFRNSITLVLTGLEIEAKATLALETIAGITLDDVHLQPKELASKSRLPVAELSIELIRGDGPNPATISAGQAHLRLEVKDADPKRVGKSLTAPVVESALASYPGLFPTSPPSPGTPFGVFWPTDVSANQVKTLVSIDGADPVEVPSVSGLAVEAAHYQSSATQDRPAESSAADSDPLTAAHPKDSGTESDGSEQSNAASAPLGLMVGARSGDKGGNANVGVWVPDPSESESVALAAGQTDVMVVRQLESSEDTVKMWESDWPLPVDPEGELAADQTYKWLRELISTPADVHRLLPDSRGLAVEIHPLDNLRAINIVIRGLLGKGVSENTSLDPQAKGLGELLRARIVSVPPDLATGVGQE